MPTSLVAFDTETTGLTGPPHLLELGAVRIEEGEIVDHFTTLVRPEVPIEPEAGAVHGIDDDAVRDAPDAGRAIALFLEFAGDAWFAAHDAPRDAHVLGFECARHGIDPPDRPVLDSVALARKLIPESPDHRLETLVRVLDLEVETEHRALPDAVACWKVVEECLARAAGEGEGEPRVEALLALAPRITTLADGLPTAPRVPRRLRPIQQAIAGGERVVLHYGDPERGDGPVPLAVTPRLLFRMSERGYLEGECASTGLLKTYRLDRVRRVAPA